MSSPSECFIDANVIVYSATPGARREPCMEILEALGSESLRGRTSPSVLEEVWHLERTGRAGDIRGLTLRALELFAPLVAVTEEAFRLAMAIQASASLGANDRLHVGTCLANGIRIIVSADAAFDAVSGISRVDPLDEAARRKLLAG